MQKIKTKTTKPPQKTNTKWKNQTKTKKTPSQQYKIPPKTKLTKSKAKTHFSTLFTNVDALWWAALLWCCPGFRPLNNSCFTMFTSSTQLNIFQFCCRCAPVHIQYVLLCRYNMCSCTDTVSLRSLNQFWSAVVVITSLSITNMYFWYARAVTSLFSG